MAGISSKALAFGAPENKKKFNEGTERNFDFDLHWDETDCRTYDPQIGRFLQVDPFSEISDELSPFVYANNNPILRNDPYGLKDTVVNGESANTAATLETVVVYGRKPKPQDQNSGVNPSTAGATPLPIGPLPNLYPVNPPGKIIPFSRPVTNPGTGMGWSLVSRFAGVVVAAMWPSPVGLGSERPHPSFTPAPGFVPYPGHGNNRDNSDPHIVYQFTFTPSDGRTPVVKYGISDEYRYGLERPENQHARLSAMFGATVTMKILTRTLNRDQALIIEQSLVDRHYAQWRENPRDQKRPVPTPLK